MPGYANKEFVFEFISHGGQRQRVTDGKTDPTTPTDLIIGHGGYDITSQIQWLGYAEWRETTLSVDLRQSTTGPVASLQTHSDEWQKSCNIHK